MTVWYFPLGSSEKVIAIDLAKKRKERKVNAYKKSYKQSLRVSSGGAVLWELLINSKSRAKWEEIYSSPIASNKRAPTVEYNYGFK